MNIWPKIIGHGYRKEFQENLILNEKVICVERDFGNQDHDTIKSQLEAQKERIEAQKQHIQDLEKEFREIGRNDDLSGKEKAEQRGQIFQAINEEKRVLTEIERGTFDKNRNLLQSKFRENITQLKIKRIQQEDREYKAALGATIEACEGVMESLSKKIENEDDLVISTNSIDLYDYLLDKLYSEKIDGIDIDFLLESELQPFFDGRFRSELEQAKQSMNLTDLTFGSIYQGRLRHTQEETVNRAWLEHVKEIDEEIHQLEIEEMRLGIKRTANKITDAEERKQKANIEMKVRALRNQKRNGATRWKEKKREEHFMKDYGRVNDFVDPGSLNQLKQLVSEAKDMRIEKIHEYLEERFEDVEREFEAIKSTGGLLDDEEADLMEEKIEEARMYLLNKNIIKPQFLKQISKNLEATKQSLQQKKEELTGVEQERDPIEAKLKEDYKKLQANIAKINPSLIQKAEVEFVEQLRERGDTVTIIDKAIGPLRELADQNSELRKTIDALDEKINGDKKLTASELKDLSETVSHFSNRMPLKDIDKFIQLVENPNYKAVKKANEAIRALETGKKSTLAVLRETIGLEDLSDQEVISEDGKKIAGNPNFKAKVLSKAEFKQYKDYTNGNMVFFKRGEEWYIFIEEGAENSERLRKQVIHELLHVVFENGGTTLNKAGELTTIKEEAKKAYQKEFPGDWKKVAKAFREMARYTRQKDPEGSYEWKDEDHILSEIFAMQKEWGQERIEKEDVEDGKLNPIHIFNNLLHDLHVKQAVQNRMGDLNKKAKTFDDSEEIAQIFGDKGGVPKGFTEAGEEAIDFSKLEGDGVKPINSEQASFNKNQLKIRDLDHRIEEIRKSKHLRGIKGARPLLDAMGKYNKNTALLNRHNLDDNLNLQDTIDKRIGKVSDQLDKLDENLSDISSKEQNKKMGFMSKLWDGTAFYSIADFVQMGVDFKEYWDRRFKRRNAANSAELGMTFFKGTGFGYDSRARKEKSESEEVNQWMENYKEIPPWELLQILESISKQMFPNKDQFKALIRTLAEKGRLDWRNQDLWRILNRMQGAAYFPLGDQKLLRDPTQLRKKMMKAMGTIFDLDEFPDLDRKADSSYESKKKEYENLNKKTSTQLTARLDELLDQYVNGDPNLVDPHEYESILEFGMVQGKSYGENLIFHLMCGMARGLLPPDRGIALGAHANTYPPVQWFENLNYNQEDFRRLCETHFKKDYEAGNLSKHGGREFKNWFITTIPNDFRINDRVQKSVNGRSWDPDFCRTILIGGTAETTRQFYSGRASQTETKFPAIANHIVGEVQMLEENAINPMYATRGTFANMAARIAMTNGILDGTAYRGVDGTVDTYARGSDDLENWKPGEAGIGRYGTMTVNGHRKILNNFLDMIDPEFFGMIRGKQVASKQAKTDLAKRIKGYLRQKHPGLMRQMNDMSDLESVDQIFGKIDTITNYMVAHMSTEDYNKMLGRIAANAKKAEQG